MAGRKTGKLSRRLQLACEPCRASKLKCDRALPRCEQCYKRSRESVCIYTEKGLRYNASAQAAESLKEKLDRLELLVHSLRNGHQHEEPLVTQQKTKMLSSSSAQKEGSIQPNTKYYLASEGAKRHPSRCHAERTLEEIVPVPDVYFCQPQHFTQDVLLNSLPPRSIMDKFVAAWLNLMDPIRVILHAPTFQEQYEIFWQNPQAVSPACLALVLAVSCLGAEISAQAQDDSTIQTQADLLRKLTLHALALANPTRSQPWLIESLVLYIVGILYHQHEVTTHVWQLTGSAVRLCLLAGYHRDPSRYSNFSSFVCEMRRRVWMVVCEIEVVVSSGLGMASSLNHTLYDTLPPSNLAETDLSPTQYSAPRIHQECTLVQTEMCFARLQRIFGDIVTSAQAVLASSRNEVEMMGRRLDQARNDLPERLKVKPLAQSFIDSPIDIVDRLRFEFAYQKALCVLYQRFLGDESAEPGRQKCLGAAETIVRLCVSMLQSAQQGGQLAPFKVLLLRHVHDFTFAATLICSSIKDVPSIDADDSNHLPNKDIHGLILQACHMWDKPSLRSQRAKVALRIIALYLQGSLPSDLTQTTLSNGPELLCQGNRALTALDSNCGVGIGAEVHYGQDPSERFGDNDATVYSSVSESSCNLPDGGAADWPWPTAVEVDSTSVIGFGQVHSVMNVH